MWFWPYSMLHVCTVDTYTLGLGRPARPCHTYQHAPAMQRENEKKEKAEKNLESVMREKCQSERWLLLRIRCKTCWTTTGCENGLLQNEDHTCFWIIIVSTLFSLHGRRILCRWESWLRMQINLSNFSNIQKDWSRLWNHLLAFRCSSNQKYTTCYVKSQNVPFLYCTW